MTDKERVMQPAANEDEAFRRLVDVIRVLRAPDGCPWDKVQTHETLIRPMIEEAYEAVEAMENGDVENMREEFGDVLLQVIMNSHIAEDEGEFSLKDVMEAESEKMIGRHPHVFGENLKNYGVSDVDSVDKVLDLWENVKRDEHKIDTQTESMKKIPRHLPALLRADKVQAKAAKVGFDWDSVDGAFDKVSEETKELLEAKATGDQKHIEEELGDLLFAVVNVARFLKVDPEEALSRASDKFVKRFSYVEENVLASGRKMQDASFEELDHLWDEAKLKQKK